MKKIFIALLFICAVFVNGCSCDKFNINSYASAVKKYNNSTGIDYKLTVTTYTEGSDKYMLEESFNKYRFSSTRQVENFSSQLKKYEIIVNSYSGNSAPQKVYEINRYYVGEERKFYSNEIAFIDDKQVENKTYEDKYDENSPYHVSNIVPTFNTEFISDFKIVKDPNNKRNSIATFYASCPLTNDCDEDFIQYTVRMDRNFYFKSIEFSVVNGDKRSEYKYEFYKYNGDVEIIFPQDLANY